LGDDALAGGHGGEDAVLGEEFVEATLFDNAAFLDDEDLVHGAEGGEAMGDADDGAIFGEVVDGFLDFGFGLGVEGGGGFVEDEDGGVADEGAGDGDALALSAREAEATFAERGVVTVGEGFDEVVGVGFAGGGDDFIAGGAGFSEGNIFSDGGVEEEDVLADEGEMEAEVGEAEGFDGFTVDFDLAEGGVIESEEEVDEGTFSGTAFTSKSEAFTSPELEIDFVEDGAVAVGEADVAEFDAVGELGHGDGIFSFADSGLEFEERHETFKGDGEVSDVNADAAEFLERSEEEAEGDDEGDHLVEGAVGPEGVEEDGADTHGVEGLDDGAEHLATLDAFHVEVGRPLRGLVEGLGVNFFQRVGLGDADVLERFHGDVSLANIGGEVTASQFLDFSGDEAGGNDTEGKEGEGNKREFPVDEKHHAENTDDGDRFLDEVGEAEFEKVVEVGTISFNAGDEFAGGCAMKVIERERTDLAKGISFDVIGDALAAPGEEVTAAVSENTAQDDTERYEKQAAEALFPIERTIFQGKPWVNDDVELFLEGPRLRFQAMYSGTFPFFF